jgi:hypothetical protein
MTFVVAGCALLLSLLAGIVLDDIGVGRLQTMRRVALCLDIYIGSDRKRAGRGAIAEHECQNAFLGATLGQLVAWPSRGRSPCCTEGNPAARCGSFRQIAASRQPNV